MTRLLFTFVTASACCIGLPIAAQGTPPTRAVSTATTRIAELGLSPDATSRLSAAMEEKDLRGAEALLLNQLSATPERAQKARLLSYLGGVYFEAADYLQAAVAWKKADALVPLQPSVRFSLAMTFVRLGRSAWAAQELEKLSIQQPADALYPYWLGRISYDAQAYDVAIQHLLRAVKLDPAMARAHDSLGLCYFYLNQNTLAEQEFRKAIALESTTVPAAAWPHLNLGILLEFRGELDAAVSEVQTAVALDPALPQAKFELGNLFEKQGHLAEAAGLFRQAAQLDPQYPEPHVALARVLRRQGDSAGAEREVATYKTLHAKKVQEGPAQTGPS